MIRIALIVAVLPLAACAVRVEPLPPPRPVYAVPTYPMYVVPVAPPPIYRWR